MALPNSREMTFAPGSQVPSAVLNAIQDAIIAMATTGSFATVSGSAVNISALGPDVVNYIRLRNWIIVFGQVSYTNSGVGAKAFNLSLAGAEPASNFVVSSQALGWFAEEEAGVVTPGNVRAVPGSKQVQFRWSTSASSGARSAQFFFIYSV